MIPSTRTLLCSLALVAGFAAAPARAAATPLWKVMVPAPGSTSNSSTLTSVTSDSAGDALIIIVVKNNGTPVSTQLILLNPKGVKIWGIEAPLPSADPVFVSAKRVIVSTQGGLNEFYFDKVLGTVVGMSIDTESPDEVAVQPTPANLTYKYLHTTITTNNFVTDVKRYLNTKLP